MDISPHLTFDGTCRAAFDEYARTLGGTITFMATYGESPMATDVPEAWRTRIMHATLTLPGGGTLMGSDARPEEYETPRGFAIAVSVRDPDAARRAFDAFADGGTVRLPLAETFWSAAFGVVTDRFGITWEINCEQGR